MRRLSAALILAALAMPAVAARTPSTAEQVLAGRVAGASRSCIPQVRSSGNARNLDDHTMIYDGYGSTVYLNRPPSCDALTANRGIVSVSHGSQLCRGDIFQIVEFQTGMTYGSCAFGDFVPYSKPKPAKRAQ